MPPLSPSSQRADLLLAAVVFIGALISALLSAVAGIYGEEQASLAWAVGYAFALAGPLAVRRRWPATVAVIASTAYFLAVTLRIPELYAGNIAMFIALYTLGAWSTNRKRALYVRAGIIVGMFGWLFIAMFIDATASTDEPFSRAGAFSPFVAYSLLTILLNAMYFGGAWYFGERSWAAMRQRAALEERTLELEHERELTAAHAVTLERVRIARELHDVVAHHVSLMGVQAGVARTVMTNDPDAARETLTQIEGSARSALTELRHLLETLRTTSSTDTAPTTVGLDAIPDLVAEAASAGLPTQFTVIGEVERVPSVVQVNLYRIAQEALTNARRHGGSDARADVRLRYSPTAVELEIANTGRTVLSAKPGMGHVGMRERAAASGGTIELRPRSTGGFLVRAQIPLEENA